MKNFIRWIQTWLGFFIIILVLSVSAYFGIKARSTTTSGSDVDPLSMYTNAGETLKSSKWNSMVDTAYYPKYAYKDRTWDFSITTTNTRTTDTTMNTDIAVQQWDLVMVMVSGNLYNSTAWKTNYARIVLVSWDGTMLDSNSSNVWDVWSNDPSSATWNPFILTAFVKANSTGTLTVGYQCQINGWSWLTRAVKVKAIVIGKTN